MFSRFPVGIDPMNTCQGIGDAFQVAQLTSSPTETAYSNIPYNQAQLGSLDRPTVPSWTIDDSINLLGLKKSRCSHT